jgi:hypothetical protein
LPEESVSRKELTRSALLAIDMGAHLEIGFSCFESWFTRILPIDPGIQGLFNQTLFEGKSSIGQSDRQVAKVQIDDCRKHNCDQN